MTFKTEQNNNDHSQVEIPGKVMTEKKKEQFQIWQLCGRDRDLSKGCSPLPSQGQGQIPP